MSSHLFSKYFMRTLKWNLHRRQDFSIAARSDCFPVGRRRRIRAAGAETLCVSPVFDTECWWRAECERQSWEALPEGSEVKINEERQPRVKLALADLSVKPTQSGFRWERDGGPAFNYRRCCFIKIANPTIAGWTHAHSSVVYKLFPELIAIKRYSINFYFCVGVQKK